MLPSTGHFKSFICPFYDSGLCERPYCHFRHAKKDPNAGSNGLENGAILQQLVSEAVKKVLQQSESGISSINVPKSAHKLTYNPTPISELQKNHGTDSAASGDESDTKPRRHIPVPYTPHRPTTAVVKRIVDDDTSKPFIYNPPNATYSPGSGDIKKPDPYLPIGGENSNGKYEPGSEVPLQTYVPHVATPTDKVILTSADKVSYVPSGLADKPPAKKKLIEYEPTRASVNAGMSKYLNKRENETSVLKVNDNSGLKYRPTPLSKVPCFSSDEEEPEPKKKKSDASLNGIDLDTEFELLGQILDEEHTIEESEKTIEGDSSSKEENKIAGKEKNKNSDRSQKERLTKKDHKSSQNKEKRQIDKTKTTCSNSSSSSKSHKNHYKDKEKQKYTEKHKSKHSDKHKKESNSSPKTSSSSKSNSHHSDKSSKSSSQKNHTDKSKDSKSSKSHSRSRSSKDKKENRSSKEKDRNKSHKVKSRIDNNAEVISDDAHFDELIEELSDPDEDTIAMECMKIFEEYVPSSKPIQIEEIGSKDESVDEYVPTKKRISHTSDKIVKVIHRPPVKPNYKVNAAQAMAQRITKIKEFHTLQNISTNAVEPSYPPTQKVETSNNTETSKNNISKVRIAHVPNVLLYAKKPSATTQCDKNQPSTSTTVQTIPKGSSRTAHVPNDKFCDRPGVLEPLASKIPANLRSTFLNKMIDECLKIYIIPADAYARAQQEELCTSKKCTTIPIYKNSAVLAISRLRKEFQESGGVKKTSFETESSKHSHSQVLLGKLAHTSWSIEKAKKTDFSNEFKGAKFYKNISQWVLDDEQLQKNGFPRPHPDGEKGKAKIYTVNERQIPPRGRLRTCCRCKKEYTVDKRGLPAVKEDCNYHPNRKYRFRGEVRYQCCSQDENSEGCAMAPTHVFEYVDYDNLRGYVRTMPKDVPDPDNHDYGVFALDCEMCYTSHGLDLTRITVINSSCKTVYETLIKPLHPIVDYNTRYSGITEEQMANVSTTLLEVQATLLSMFSSKTIIVGHSLESDFKALKLIHDTVVDTSVLFPHKMGPPYKRALRNLSSEHLKKIIQNSVDGHDSAEDATVCMELIQWKLKEDLKLR